MKSTTRLDSLVFHLTPTRTRCDLVVIANRKTEKIVSGLLNPFLAHLKTAQEQMAKGGYSIMLEPSPGSDAMWFTKGTVERFVRFVSTPEVLERVNTIESEILQIEETIAFQRNENLGLNTVDDYQTRSVKSIEGSKAVSDADDERAIVLYKPGMHPPQSNGSTIQEENSKVKLLKVLETRKTVLQKEQGMAFARAVAAGFDVDHMAPLVSFAECFKATRLMEACIRFMDLWKEKHESGQWLEIEEAEAMSCQSDLSFMNVSGKQNEFSEALPASRGELDLESNGKAKAADAAMNYHNGDKKHIDPQLPFSHHNYFQGQFQHHIFPQWPALSPAGAAPVFQGYPMQGMPYYQAFPGNTQFFPPPYPPPMEDSRFSDTQGIGQKIHSMDSKDSTTTESEKEMGVSSSKSLDGLALEKEGSQGREPRRKAGQSSKGQSGMVVVQNINYITSNSQDSSGSESHSASDSEADKEGEDLQVNVSDLKHKNSPRSSRSKGSGTRSSGTWGSYDKDDTICGQGTDGGQWQAFQDCLLRDDNRNSHMIKEGMFAMGNEAQVRKRQSSAGGDPIIPHGLDSREYRDERMIKFDSAGAKLTHMPKLENEELLLSKGELPGGGSRGIQIDGQLTEMAGGRRGFGRSSNDEIMIYRQKNLSGVTNSLQDPLSENIFEHAANNFDRNSSQNVIDESFIVPVRSVSVDQVGTDNGKAIDISSELPPALQKTEDQSGRIKSQLSYEPNDLSLMRQHMSERETIGYDPAVEYEMQIHNEGVAVQSKSKKTVATKKGLEKSKVIRDASDKRKIEAVPRKGKQSKLSPLTDAQARAESIRALKVDLRKMKKEKEQEEIQRLEALKKERQKRIAARGSSSPDSSLPSQPTKSRLPTKLSPSVQKSKFNDPYPAMVSPLRSLHTRTASMGSNDSQKISKINGSSGVRKNGLSRSLPSLPVQKRKIDTSTPELKVAANRTRRLSEPKTSGRHHISSVKSQNADLISNPKIGTSVPESKVAATRTRRLSEPKTSGRRHISSVKSRNADLVSNPKIGTSVPESKVAATRTRRLSEPKTGGRHHISSVKSQNAELLSNPKIDSTPESKVAATRTRRLSEPKTSGRHHISSVKTRNAELVSNPKLSKETETEKISAIMHLDKTKGATLPEIKIRTSKGPSDMRQNKSAAKEAVLKTNVDKSSVSLEATKFRSNDKAARSSSGDDNAIIEKTVLMLEPVVPLIPIAQAFKEKMDAGKGPNDENKGGEITEVVSEYAAIRAPVSPLNGDASDCDLAERPDLREVTEDFGMDKLPQVSSISVSNKPYQAPLARNSSLEDPCTTNLEFTKAPATNSEMGITSAETTKACVFNFSAMNSSGKSPEALEKPQGKESAGFRRLLKFGKKNHSKTVAEHHVESDKLTVEGVVANDHDPSSDEVHTLKNLILQDETPELVTTQKVSRPFSLLSPFRSKNSGKKLAT